jgi:hypothetical protein
MTHLFDLAAHAIVKILPKEEMNEKPFRDKEKETSRPIDKDSGI